MDPNAGAPAPTPSPAVQEIEFEGQKYPVADLVKSHTEFSKLSQEDLKSLPSFKEESENFKELLGFLQGDPSLWKQVQETYNRRYNRNPSPVQPPAQPGAPADQSKEFQERLKAIKEETDGRVNDLEATVHEIRSNEELRATASMYPFLKDDPQKLMKAAVSYCQEKSKTLPGDPRRNFSAAMDGLSMLPMSEWPAIVMREDYHKWLLDQRPGTLGKPVKVNPPAEGAGAPGPTPAALEQFKQQLRDAISRGDQAEVARLSDEFSRSTGGKGYLEEMGLSPELARGLSARQ